MPLEFFTPLGTGQGSPSVSAPMAHQQNMSASQPIAQNVSVSQPMGQFTASAPQPMVQQQYIAFLIQPATPTEVLISRLPHQGGMNWVFHDPASGSVRHVNILYAHPLA